MKTAAYILAALMLSGCVSQRSGYKPAPRPQVNSVVELHEVKDLTLLGEAAAIDAIAPQAKPHTDAQRAAIAQAPASEIKNALGSYEKLLDSIEKENARLLEKIQKLENVELKYQGRALTILGFAFIAGFGLSFFGGGGLLAATGKTWPLALIGLGCFGAAQIVTHPYFMPAVAALIVISVAYTIYWVIDRKRQGRLKQSLSKRTSALRKIVPILDDAKKSASESIREILERDVFSVLSATMSSDEKAEVHAIRSEQKNGK